MNKKKTALAGVGAVLAGLSLSACGTEATNPSQVTLRYSDGVNSGEKYKECLQGGRKITGDDQYYRFPKTQRFWQNDTSQFEKKDRDGNGFADDGDIVVTTKDLQQVNVQSYTGFQLNTSCKGVEVDGKQYPGGTLQVWNELFSRDRGADFTETGKYGNGWRLLLQNNIGRNLVKAYKEEARSYTTLELTQDTAVQEKVAEAVAKKLPTLVDDSMETDLSFFKNYSVSITGATPPKSWLETYEAKATAINEADAAVAKKKSEVAKADAEAAVARAEANKLKAEISGYGSAREYNIAQCIQTPGCQPFQPTIVGSAR